MSITYLFSNLSDMSVCMSAQWPSVHTFGLYALSGTFSVSGRYRHTKCDGTNQ